MPLHESDKLGAIAARQRRLMDDNAAPGFLDRGDDGVEIDGRQRPQVDHFGVDAALRRRSDRDMDHRAVGEYGHRASLPGNGGFAERHEVMATRHVAVGMAFPARRRPIVMAVERTGVEAFRLEEDDRIIVLYRGDQEALTVIGIGGNDSLQAANMGEQGLGALAMRLAAEYAAAIGRADGQG